jgi:hypothetical protein
LLTSSKSPKPLSTDPRQRRIDEKLLSSIDPNGTLPGEERKALLIKARREYFKDLARQRLEKSSELQYLIKLTARAIARQVKVDASEKRGGGDDGRD